MALTIREALATARRRATAQGALRVPVERTFLAQRNVTSLDSVLTLTQFNAFQIAWMRASGVEKPVLTG